MKKFVEMGKFYRNNDGTLVKTVCRGIDDERKEVMIAYVFVEQGGCASNIHLMPEDKFINTFLD